MVECKSTKNLRKSIRVKVKNKNLISKGLCHNSLKREMQA